MTIQQLFLLILSIFSYNYLQAQVDTVCVCKEDYSYSWECFPLERMKLKEPTVLFSDYLREGNDEQAKIHFEKLDSLLNEFDKQYPHCFKYEYVNCKNKGIILFQNMLKKTDSEKEKDIFNAKIEMLISQRKKYNIQTIK